MLNEKISRLLEGKPGDISVLIQDLSSASPVCAISDTRRFVSASVIKTPIMLSLFDEVSKGYLSLTDDIKVCTVLSDSLTFQRPRKASILELVTWMIIDSDNTSTNTLINLLGFNQINLFIQNSLSLKDTSLSRLMLDFEAIKLGKNNYTTNQDVFTIFKKLFDRSILTPALCDIAIGILRKQRDTKKLPRLIWEDGVSFAHKTGGLDYLCHDAGIITFQGQNIYVGVFEENCEQTDGYPELIGEIGRLAYDFFKLR
jgi:beta-lactamase class A